MRDKVFDGSQARYDTWRQAPADAAALIWETSTRTRKLSAIAEEFFRLLSMKMGTSMLLKKGELHRLIPNAELSADAEAEVRAKLDALQALFEQARLHDETEGSSNTQPEGAAP